jgi:hypothetical protein
LLQAISVGQSLSLLAANSILINYFVFLTPLVRFVKMFRISGEPCLYVPQILRTSLRRKHFPMCTLDEYAVFCGTVRFALHLYR